MSRLTQFSMGTSDYQKVQWFYFEADLWWKQWEKSKRREVSSSYCGGTKEEAEIPLIPRILLLRLFCIMWAKLPSMMALYRIPPWISCSDLTCHNWQWNNFNTVWVSVLHFIRHMSVSNKYVFGYLLDSTWHTLWDTAKTIFRNCVISILYKILSHVWSLPSFFRPSV